MCMRVMAEECPDIIIHCAAFVDALGAETEKELCWRVNVDGTRNVARAAAGSRLIYISSEYVFDGEEGYYSEDDTPNPINFYGLTKLAGELIAQEHPNALILRAGFRSDPPWRYARAFVDQWTSGRFVSEVAVDVARAALMRKIGILHIGGPRRTVFELAEVATPGIGQMKRADVAVRLPRDTSLDSTTWHFLSAL